MKNVFIKYNPYKLETEFTIDGKELKVNSKLREAIKPGHRLQEWVETLPQILFDEQGERTFKLTFHGILSDYEDVVEVFTKAYKELGLKVQLDRIPARETSDKEKLIEDVFQKILKESPFPELKGKDIQDSFNKVKSSDFEVCVVATMSAGKSTLINAMLGTKLMPSKQGACTAIITKIKDVDENYGKEKWKAKVYNKDGRLTETHEEIDLSKMEDLNANENIARIEMEGDIPFVSAEDISLVLVDTPGPNNSCNKEHRKVQSNFLDSSSKTLVLYIMEPTFGSDSDNELLQNVAESMKVGGKQSKDRFIFVLNKIDARDENDDKVEDILENVRGYLEKKGINEPNLFPAAALPALNIRLISEGKKVDKKTFRLTEVAVDDFNENKMLHLEQYAPLPRGIKEKIKKDAEFAKENENAYQEALIHTGIVSVEAAIRQYVQKYAKTAKIKNLVDTFQHKLESAQYFTKLQNEIAENSKKKEEIRRKLSEIQTKIDGAKEGQKFKDAVDVAVNDVIEKLKNSILKIVVKLEEKITKRTEKTSNDEITYEEAKEEEKKLSSFAKGLEDNFQKEIDKLLDENLLRTGKALLDEYKRKTDALAGELSGKENSGISIDPLKLMEGNLGDIKIDDLLRTKRVEDGDEWVKNTDKAWYKPWTWFQEKGYWRTKYKDVEFVSKSEFAQTFLSPVQDELDKNKILANKHVEQQAKKIADEFVEKFKVLDNILKEKIKKLEDFTKDEKDVKNKIEECRSNKDWLEKIQAELESVLEI